MAHSAKRQRRLWDASAFPGLRPLHAVRGVFGEPKAARKLRTDWVSMMFGG